MPDIFDYLLWRGDLDFSQTPVNPVDYLIFSQMSYLPFDGIVPGQDGKESISVYLALKNLEERIKNENPEIKPKLIFREDLKFITALSSSARFKNCQIFGFINKIDADMESQFSAVCIYANGNFHIVFRGTDLNFVGWKEDLNMAFMETIPSQIEAVKYVESMFPKIKNKFSICGHSKGGNLAAYSSAFCGKKIQDHITGIYCFDSPGFTKNIIESVEFRAVNDRVHSFIPQGSVVGMLLEHGNKHTVVKSNEAGLMQHSLFSWEITHNDMVKADNITQGSLFVDKTIREWVGNLNSDQHEKFVEAIYSILTASEMNSLYDIEGSWLTAAGKIIKSLGNIDKSTKKLIFNVISELFRSAGRNINTLQKPTVKGRS